MIKVVILDYKKNFCLSNYFKVFYDRNLIFKRIKWVNFMDILFSYFIYKLNCYI